MNPVFRAYRPTDSDDCLALFDANCPAFFAANERAEYLTFLTTAAASYQVCVADRRVVGGYGLTTHQAGGLALRWILLSPEVHGLGLGSVMMNRVLDTLRANPVRRLHISASHKSAPFFARFGTREVAITRDGWGPAMHRVDLVLEI